jgi:hypothetical protein
VSVLLPQAKYRALLGSSATVLITHCQLPKQNLTNLACLQVASSQLSTLLLQMLDPPQPGCKQPAAASRCTTIVTHSYLVACTATASMITVRFRWA